MNSARSISRVMLAVGLIAVATVSFAQTPKPAKEVIEAARKEAAATGRAVFVRFTASWCGWCHRMDGVLSSPAIKPLWDKYFVSVPIVVLESEGKKNLEHPGGAEIMEANGGKNQGIPYFYFMDKDGKAVANSFRPSSGVGDKGGNVGCPFEANEIAHFMAMLKKGAPKMTEAERKTLQTAFEELKKKDGKAGS